MTVGNFHSLMNTPSVCRGGIYFFCLQQEQLLPDELIADMRQVSRAETQDDPGQGTTETPAELSGRVFWKCSRKLSLSFR